jgi:hypothetical protein
MKILIAAICIFGLGYGFAALTGFSATAVLVICLVAVLAVILSSFRKVLKKK